MDTNEQKKLGKLFVVGTPIGNLEDITYRAVRILREADLIICEDTRHSRILFNKYNIGQKYISYHQHSKVIKLDFIINQLMMGKNVAMISDAGTPGICDPGEKLIEEAVKKNISIVTIPGPSALISILSISGFISDKFLFLGYLPKKKGRTKLLSALKNISHYKLYESIVLYVTPYQFIKTLNDLNNNLGNRNIVVGRELTKKFEEIFRGDIKKAIDYFSSKKILGEFVICINN